MEFVGNIDYWGLRNSMYLLNIVMFFLGTVQLSFETKTEVVSGGTGTTIWSYDNPSPIVTLKKS